MRRSVTKPRKRLAKSYAIQGQHQEEQHQVRISVRDNGLGIAVDLQSSLFEPFQRGAAERSTIEGTGVGLAITQQLVELMGGTIGFHSAEDQGSEFWVTLPQAQPSTAASDLTDKAQALATAAPMAAHLPEHCTVLCVDDNLANLKLITQILQQQRMDIEVVPAHTAQLGIDLAQAHRPDLILLDINMPHLDGYQVLQRLRQLPATAHTPIVAVTAEAIPAAIQKGLAAGFDGYGTKPLEVAPFLQLVDTWLQRSRIRHPTP